ncbi:MAG: PAS domain S-box protein [Proteobacteria bacterium]|nr:PAS domain S-box protein [Desulfobacula sp.]MBU3951374.1 PAS domain S-box protein [Pseudomonadota bacterium]MBU4130504.1 PAS domain S-box protein [Pseudomonadota bacterium]
MIVSFIPILVVDVVGSVAMVVIALLCLNKARRLRGMDPANAVFLYLLWISTGFTIFAVSRSFGHILRQFLILTSNAETWHTLAPYSGSVNTVSFMLVGLITLFFKQSWHINEKILSSRKRLEETHIKLVDLNQTLEQKVVARTEMLTSSEHKARRIFEQSLDTIVVTDEGFRVSEINQAGVALTGYKKGEMLEKKMGLKDFMAKASEWERIRGLLEVDEYILNEETDFALPNFSQVRVLITGGVDYGAFGCGKTFHFIIKNINDKKQMEQQIAQADKLAALGELSAGVAHEINNPLGIILGYTQLMLKEASGFEEDLKTIEKHVQNCRTVVSDLLSFSRKGSPEKRRLDVARVIDNVIKFLSNHTDFRKVEIGRGPLPMLPLMVYGNEQELAQVIINLIINACHAVGKNGRIEIETGETKDRQVLITVKDNGTGIRKRHFSRLFDPFFTTKPVGQGTGLGLSVGYGIIRRHGGDITARNREKKGAAFTISLPSAPAEETR